jgi:hypothetical protein
VRRLYVFLAGFWIGRALMVALGLVLYYRRAQRIKVDVDG